MVGRTVPCSFGEIYDVHAIGLIRIEDSRRQLGVFGIGTVTEKRLDHRPLVPLCLRVSILILILVTLMTLTRIRIIHLL